MEKAVPALIRVESWEVRLPVLTFEKAVRGRGSARPWEKHREGSPSPGVV